LERNSTDLEVLDWISGLFPDHEKLFRERGDDFGGRGIFTGTRLVEELSFG
jgi:hypothetical protein